MKPTLLVLAAGMGSRYGGLKQMDGVGPNGEIIMDYSITDAIRAGFGKVVFVIRHSFADAFKQIYSPERFGGKIDVEFVYQELESWIAEGVLRRRLKDASYRANIPLEDLLGITNILPRAAADPAAGGERTHLRMPVRLESILEHKALLEQIRKVAESSMG